MAVKMRLKRMGAKKAPFYRIVVADSRSPRDGKFIEQVGYYDPTKNPSEFKIDEEVAKKWLSTGAQPSDTVRKLLKIAGIVDQKTSQRRRKKLVELIAKSLVDDPNAVEVNEVEGEKSTIIELKVAQEDMGKVIGKQGRIAKAIRTVVKAAAIKSDKRVVVEIL